MQTQIRLLLEEQSDQGLHCLLFSLHFGMHYSKEKPSCSTFRVITENFRVLSEILGFLRYPPRRERMAQTLFQGQSPRKLRGWAGDRTRDSWTCTQRPANCSVVPVSNRKLHKMSGSWMFKRLLHSNFFIWCFCLIV